jgi:hypothetical protein
MNTMINEFECQPNGYANKRRKIYHEQNEIDSSHKNLDELIIAMMDACDSETEFDDFVDNVSDYEEKSDLDYEDENAFGYEEENDLDYDDENDLNEGVYVEDDATIDEHNDYDFEDAIWNLRKRMVGLKNITRTKMEGVIEESSDLFDKLTASYKIELAMDVMKYLHKCTIREFISEEEYNDITATYQIGVSDVYESVPASKLLEYETFLDDMYELRRT